MTLHVSLGGCISLFPWDLKTGFNTLLGHYTLGFDFIIVLTSTI